MNTDTHKIDFINRPQMEWIWLGQDGVGGREKTQGLDTDKSPFAQGRGRGREGGRGVGNEGSVFFFFFFFFFLIMY